MKLTLEQLQKESSSPVLPIYLIAGDETLLVEEAKSYLYQIAKYQGFSDIEKISVLPNFDWASLPLMLYARSLFTEKKIVELRINQGKVGILGSKVLQEYAKKPCADVLLTIIAEKLESKNQQAAWVKAIEKSGALVTIWPIEPQQLPYWVKQQLLKVNITLEPSALQLLCECVAGNLLAAKQEVDKLSLIYGSGTLSLDQIKQALSDQAHYDIFVLADAVLQGDFQLALKILSSLRHEDIEPILILWALTREFRTIAQIQFADPDSSQLAALFLKHQVWSKRQPLVKQALKRVSYYQALGLLQSAASVDKIIKGLEKGNCWDALQQLCLQCCHPSAGTVQL